MGNSTLQERLVAVRKNNGTTRKELSDILSIPYKTISNYENGLREPGHSYIMQIADYFGVTTDYLLCRVDDPNEYSNDATQKEKDLISSIAKAVSGKDGEMKKAVIAAISKLNEQQCAALVGVIIDIADQIKKLNGQR